MGGCSRSNWERDKRCPGCSIFQMNGSCGLFGRVGQKEKNRMIPQRTNSFRLRKSALHFSHTDSTERGNFVKALRFAPTADAAPKPGGLDKAPSYAPVLASSYGNHEEKKLGGTIARTTETAKS